MKSNIRKKGDTALSEIGKTYEVVRDELTDRLDHLASRIDDLDARALGGRAYSSAVAVRERAEKHARQVQKLRPRQRRRSLPWGVIVLSVATLGIAWFLYDSRRREMVRGQVTQLGSRTTSIARSNGVSGAVDSVMGKVRGQQQTRLDEERLRSDVESAIAGAGEGGVPDGLQVAIEGRTVYLRGTVEPPLADAAAERAQSVNGVAAVVNLTTAPQPKAPSGAPAPARRAGSA